MERTRFLIAGTLILGGLALIQPALAQQPFPSKRFTIFVPSSAGGSFDIMARLFSDHLGKKSGQPVIVDNRPGASDTLAMGAMLKEPADGHTVAMGGSQVADIFLKSVPIDLSSLTPVSIFAQTPFTVVTSKASNLNSLKDFLAYAKGEKGKLTFGAATISHSLYMRQMEIALGFDSTVVLYKGFAPLETAMVSGEVNASVFGNLGKVKSGQITAIVTAGDTRNPDIPDVPTFKELGISGYNPIATYGMWVRADTPPDLINRLVREVQEVIRTPDWTVRITKGLGPQPLGSTHEYAVKYYADEHKAFKAAADRAGIKPQ